MNNLTNDENNDKNNAINNMIKCNQNYLNVFDYCELNKDYLKLLKIWQREKFSNELYEFNNRVVEDLTYSIEKKKDSISNFSNIKENNTELEQYEFFKELYIIDLERTIFLIKDYLRIRLAKIEKYLYYIVSCDLGELLSDKEFEYAIRLYELKKAYFENNFYNKLNPSLNDFQRENKINGMVVVKPILTSYFFVRSIDRNQAIINFKENYGNNIDESINNLIIKQKDVVCLPENTTKNLLELEHVCIL